MKATQIKRLLPAVFQAAAEGMTPLATILKIMEEMHAPTEAILDHIETYFDPYCTPDAFVPVLATWVDLESVLDQHGETGASLSTGVGRLRELTAAAVLLSKWRGTRKGLSLFLETATGLKDFAINETVADSDGAVIPFHIHIAAPAAATTHRAVIERIIDLEKPAYVTYDLEFAPVPQT
jgi:phage tail-like protein